ncbi:MAG: acetyl-CoA carboxylase biotin carboxyl carrier protein [bacterium]|jgi:acetyl-CoA carboxylase biotin carboxyl carrier protein|nr:acetyl-CoA carboxylase biotin carboxyl carrier protein [bacterium]
MAGKSTPKKIGKNKTNTASSPRVTGCLPVLKELASYMDEHGLVELKWSEGKTSYHLKKAGMAQAEAAASPVYRVPPAVAAPAPEKTAEEDSGLVAIDSPIVGTFYRSASPSLPPYVEVGDVVDVNTVLCLVEAMKLMNEIQSHVKGTVRKILVKNEDAVTAGQKLFLIEPEGA